MFVLLTILHVLVCVFLIIVVLLQSGKAADLAGAFGGMGSQTAFGPRGSATLLSKATTISAVVFMVTSLALSVLATRSSGVGSTVLDSTKQTTQKKPAAPAAPPAVPAQQPGAPAGQPSVTLTPEGGGPSQSMPLKIQTVPPGQQPQFPQPSQPQQKQPAPAKK